jgi:hypothetical protein
MERLRSTDFWIAVVRLRVTNDLLEAIPCFALTVRVVVMLRLLPTDLLMRGDES